MSMGSADLANFQPWRAGINSRCNHSSCRSDEVSSIHGIGSVKLEATQRTRQYRHLMRLSLNLRSLTWKKVILLGFISAVLVALLIWGSDAWVRRSSVYCHQQIEKVPAISVAVVLGCSPKVSGRPNLFYTHRIDAAVALHQAGKVKAFIVSGDNGTHQYDEPTAMKEDLIARGIPADMIYCDYAGFRTLDSVLRADTIFGQKRFLIVSQHFHNERAIFLARQHGLEAEAFDAKDVSRRFAFTTHLREYFARVQAVLDVTVLQTQPKFAGPKVVIAQANESPPAQP
jgi:SanA protein